MKIFVFSTILIVCGFTATVKAQNNLQFNSKENLVVLNFINNISFSAAGKMPATTFNSNEISEPETGSASAIEAIVNISAIQFKYAMMMDIEVESISSVAIYNFIEEWYGTRYRMGGTTKKGIDCSAFTGTLLSSIYSFKVPRTAHEQYKICEHVTKDNLLTGDLVFFNTIGGVSHVGVYLTNGRFVHSSCSKGVTISSLDEAYYSRKFIGGGRINQ